MVAPFGCGVQTGAGAVLNTLRPNVDETLAIFGCGAVGFSAIMAAKVAGCRQIIAVGGNEHSLELAKELGATDVVNRKKLPEGQTIAQAVAEISNGGVDYAIDTSGNGNMIENAILSTSLNGKIVLLAPSGEVANFNFGKDVLMAYRTIIGCCEGIPILRSSSHSWFSSTRKGVSQSIRSLRSIHSNNWNKLAKTPMRVRLSRLLLRWNSGQKNC